MQKVTAEWLAAQRLIMEQRHGKHPHFNQKLYECTADRCVRTHWRITGCNKCHGCIYAVPRRW